jgi:hypothetical protein
MGAFVYDRGTAVADAGSKLVACTKYFYLSVSDLEGVWVEAHINKESDDVFMFNTTAWFARGASDLQDNGEVFLQDIKTAR